MPNWRARARNQIDLTLTVLLTLLCMLFISVPTLNETPLRLILGLLLILLLPGYSLVTALFPRRDDLDEVERSALSFGLSIAIVPLLGLALNYTPIGIRMVPILLILSTFTISLSFVALVRRLKLPFEERFRVQFKHLFNVKNVLGGTVWDKILSAILVTSIIASSATVVYVVVTPKTGERFTEFYLLGTNRTASEYPTDLKVGKDVKVIIGIINYEYENITYRLEVNFDGSLIYKEHIFLIEKGKWEKPITFILTQKVEHQKLEFLLYKNKQREAYRILHLWVSVT